MALSRGPGLSTVASLVLMVGALVGAACAAPAEQVLSCPAVGGGADEALFTQNFSRMDLASGTPDTGEGGVRHSRTEPVVVVATTLHGVEAHFCARERSRASTIMYAQPHTLPAGESRVDLGPVARTGDYVIRVSVEGKLVKNLTFTVR